VQARHRVARCADALGDVVGAAVAQVVAVDRGDPTKRRPIALTVSARCAGSSASSGRGLPWATSQNGQRRVQMSPITRKVAVP
jgi:hypothetical protein